MENYEEIWKQGGEGQAGPVTRISFRKLLYGNILIIEQNGATILLDKGEVNVLCELIDKWGIK